MRAADNGGGCCRRGAEAFGSGDEYLSGAEIGNETVDQALAEEEHEMAEGIEIL